MCISTHTRNTNTPTHSYPSIYIFAHSYPHISGYYTYSSHSTCPPHWPSDRVAPERVPPRTSTSEIPLARGGWALIPREEHPGGVALNRAELLISGLNIRRGERGRERERDSGILGNLAIMRTVDCVCVRRRACANRGMFSRSCQELRFVYLPFALVVVYLLSLC